jgi:hypothetical protein
MIKITPRKFLSIVAIRQSNKKYFLTDVPDSWMTAAISRDQFHTQDPNIVFIGYYSPDMILQAFGKFTRWVDPETWSLNHIETRAGANLPKTYGGKSSDAVYDILNYATLMFEKEKRTKFYMVESTDPRWESLISNDHTLIKQNYDRVDSTKPYAPGSYITRQNGSTYLYEGLVLSELKAVACTRKINDVLTKNAITTGWLGIPPQV